MEKGLMSFINHFRNYKSPEILPQEKENVARLLENIEKNTELGKVKVLWKTLIQCLEFILLIWMIFVNDLALRLTLIIFLIFLLLAKAAFLIAVGKYFMRVIFIIKKTLQDKNIQLFP